LLKAEECKRVGFDWVTLVCDYDEALAFYRDKVGFETIVDM